MISPLKIAFFGSDRFSINCLTPLIALSKKHGEFIAGIDVIARNPKKSGRGLTQLKDVPIAAFAEANNLPLLRADKKGDFPPLSANKYDLCIAVSYGRLIPLSFLESLKYGGLNVHPSLLPRHSGPAPLQRALLDGDTDTGVTVQTLHPTEFDKGDILLMEKYHIKQGESLDSLTETLSVRGGALLQQVLEQKMFDKLSSDYKIVQPSLPFTYAKKVTKDDSKIDWLTHSTEQIIRRQSTLGHLFTYKLALPKKANKQPSLKRIVLSDLASFQPSGKFDSMQAGEFALEDDIMFIKTIDGFVTPQSINTEGIGSETGAKFFNSLKKKFNNTDTSFSK